MVGSGQVPRFLRHRSWQWLCAHSRLSVLFVRSKSGAALLWFLAFSALISAGVAYQFYRSSVESFRAQKADEKTTALRLVDAFVTKYSSLRSELGPNAPVPATFRAQSIDAFNKKIGAENRFRLRWVGRERRYIATPPTDPEMAKTIEAFALLADPKPETALRTIDGRLVLRTVYPSLAREESCVSCHNRLQADKPQWRLNDVMGAFAIDVPMAAFLEDIRNQSYALGLLLFAALATVGLGVSILHFRQTREREISAAEVQTQNIRFKAALDNMGEGLCMFDAEKRLVVCNDRYAKMYGLPPELLKVGTPHSAIIAHRVSNGILKGDTSAEAVDEKNNALGRFPTGAKSTRTDELADGSLISVTRQPMPGGGFVATHTDVTEQRRSEAKIAHMALHDGLTGLPNRVLLNERLEHALARVERGDMVAVHILDLDHFKQVNDTLGHAVGDKLLQMVSERLKAQVRETDTIARMGGDEFAIVQVSLSQAADATAQADRIITALSEPYLIDAHHVVTGTSVGISIAPTDGTSADQLIKNADLALYRAKSDGRNTFRFFEAGMDAQMQARRSLEQDLRKALASGELELHYQPISNLTSNRISGCEALIRWRHPERGMVPPSAFIPLAEETGLIVPIGEWVVRQACLTAAHWPADIKIAVNLSPAQLRSPGLPQVIISALAASGLAPDRLELEITETVLLHDSEATLAILHQLRELGVRIAMDDFGTGYSSLSHLQRFPFDKIKIDRSFVSNIVGNASSLNIVRAVAALANGLGVIATAEGVETEAQLNAVKSEGCAEMQGYLLSRPVPADEVERFFRSGKSRRKTQKKRAAA
jgi:diguanylate cyclase (GGDEF)-like protein